jgi:hypothetical protein
VTSITVLAPNRDTNGHLNAVSSVRDHRSRIATRWRSHTTSADRRHTAAYRMASDPNMPLVDLQWLLGHARITATQIYLRPRQEEVVGRLRQYHLRRTTQPDTAPPVLPDGGYRTEVLTALLGAGAAS